MSRRLAIWSFIALLFAIMIAAAAFGADEGVTAPETLEKRGLQFDGSRIQEGDGRTVAVVPIRGVIVNGRSDPAGAFTGSADIVALLESLGEADYDGVVLEIDSPGGDVLASDEMADAVRRLRKDGTEVVSWMRNSAASGGYYIAAPTDRIVAHPSTITGSIGVILEYLNLQGLSEKVGVKPIVIKSGKLKDIGSPYRDLTVEERAVLQQLIDEAYADFVKAVADGRDKLDEAEVRELADGRIYTGRQALANGLVDELGGRATAYDAIAKLTGGGDGEDLVVIEFDTRYGFFESLGASSELPDVLALARSLSGGGLAGLNGSTGAVAGGLPVAPSTLPRLQYKAVL